MNALEPILASTRAEVERRRGQALPRREGGVRDFIAALRRPGIAVIAEHKRRSPSAGPIRDDLNLEDVVAAYERGGAAALSILTEGPNFGGSLDDLRRARAASSLPILRKDFTLDAYQVDEAHAAGADAILLIVAALKDAQLAELHEAARELGLAALVEVHDARELERALALDPRLIGINNRDLTTLKVDRRRTYELRASIPGEVTVVAESGFRGPEQLRDLDVDAVLIGEALMRAGDIESAVRDLTAPTM
ncbi:MAG TPA: indole-3-glycerol phosphate synthase TrpC [Solirubrobacteraceae bacterium]|nr:indole-3-glycerol phosphate synthase TrpC [Solirubrobacteraceae bacterium]